MKTNYGIGRYILLYHEGSKCSGDFLLAIPISPFSIERHATTFGRWITLWEKAKQGKGWWNGTKQNNKKQEKQFHSLLMVHICVLLCVWTLDELPYQPKSLKGLKENDFCMAKSVDSRKDDRPYDHILLYIRYTSKPLC